MSYAILLIHRRLETWNNSQLVWEPPARSPQGLKDQVCHRPCRSGIEGGHKLLLWADSQPAKGPLKGENSGPRNFHGLLTGDLWRSSMPHSLPDATNIIDILGISLVFLVGYPTCQGWSTGWRSPWVLKCSDWHPWSPIVWAQNALGLVRHFFANALSGNRGEKRCSIQTK